MSKGVRFLLQQGQLQPHFHSEARQLSTQLKNGLWALGGAIGCEEWLKEQHLKRPLSVFAIISE